MALGHGSKKSRSCDTGIAPAALDTNREESGPQTPVSSWKKPRTWQRLLAFLVAVALILLSGGATLTWYFLEYKVWVLEPRVLKQYTASLTILNRNFSAGLSSHTSPVFRSQAGDVEDMIKGLTTATELARYFNSTVVFAFGEGSVVAHFWLVLSVPGSHVGKVTLKNVSGSLEGRLGHYRETEQGDTASYGGYLLSVASFTITETDPKVIDLLKASFDCYRYQWLEGSGGAVPLQGPDTQRSSCLWHLQTRPGSRLELRMEWLLPECRDRLLVYDAQAPANQHLITSVYGCSRLESVVRVLSSGAWLTVVWKQALYSYRDPFSLSAQTWSTPNCSTRVELEAVEGNQGSVNTPFYPGYYPPDTNCTWVFTVPSIKYGLSLEFEGYELSRADYDQTCTQGQWLVQNRRLCGGRGLQPYKERLYLLSTTTTVVMTSEVSLTGPGIQVHYSLFNQSDPCPGQFLCTVNGLCVPDCDGIKDCPNGLDERNCVCVAQYQCPEDSQCVDYFKLCDQHPDCPLAADEENCTTGVECTDMTYVCSDGTCLRKPNPHCDFISDCPDASDEKQCDCGLRQFSSRIVGGADSVEGEWPWQASLQVGGNHLCGGALVSSQWVVSAAHCFYDDRLYSAPLWTVYLGKHLLNRSSSSLEEALRVERILLHHYYDPEGHDYDLALLRLQRPLSPSTLAHAVCLPPPTHQLEPGLLCWVSGWGALREGGSPSNVLQKVDVRLVSEDDCVRSYGYVVTPRMLCAGYRSGKKDACQGDSGGPLVCQEPTGRWFLAGVVSWGKGCARPDYYGVYTRLTKLTPWIRQQIKGP